MLWGSKRSWSLDMTGTFAVREHDQKPLTRRRGSRLISRLANYFPERFLKFAFLDVAYQPPTGNFNVDAINDMSEKMLGYPIFGYWYFFNDAEAAGLMDRNVHIHSRFYLFTHSIHYILHEANMTCTAQGRVSRLTGLAPTQGQ